MINIGGNFTARGRENCTKRAVLLLSLIMLMSFLHFSVAEESKGNKTVLASLQLDRTEIQLQKGYRTQIHATVLNLPKGVRASKYEWTTSDDMVATIRNGSVKGVGGGNAELTCTATLTDDTVLTAACEVYVTVTVNELKATNRSITICTIRGDRNTGIMLNLDTNGIVALFYGRTDTADMIRELEKALQEETPELEDAGV